MTCQLDKAPTPQFYLPQQQFTDSFVVLVARGRLASAETVAAVRGILGTIAPDVPIYDVATLADRLTQSVATRSFLMRLLSLFALAALVIASVGLYGVVSQGVASREREFGIRFALGAGPRDVLQLVLRRGLALVAAGAGIGLVASIASGRLLGSQLYETTPADPLTLTAALVILFGVGFAAHLVPLRRAIRVDPTVTLRSE